jgi:hypothetical protein
MAYVFTAFLAKHYCNNVKANGSIFYYVGCEKITSGPQQFGFLGVCDGRFGRSKTFIGSGSDLDEYNGSVGSDHNKVDFAGFAGEVRGELFKAFFRQELFAAFLAPSSEEL